MLSLQVADLIGVVEVKLTNTILSMTEGVFALNCKAKSVAKLINSIWYNIRISFLSCEITKSFNRIIVVDTIFMNDFKYV